MPKKIKKPELPKHEELVKAEYVKLPKKGFKDCYEMLTTLGAVDDPKTPQRAFPQFVYLNKKDEDRIFKRVKSQLRKQYPGLIPPKINQGASMHMLDLGPNSLLETVVKEGWAIVDRGAIEAEMNDTRQT